MLLQVQVLNGEKVLVPLSGGTGAPIGSLLFLGVNVCPAGYLPLGATFDPAQYPALYQILGTNKVPDWRECTFVATGKNEEYIFDSTETDPSTGQAGTQNHDVYTVGEFKDDQLQDHIHLSSGANQNFPSQGQNLYQGVYTSVTPYNTTTYGIPQGAGYRVGTTTHGKQVGVFVCIKATSGLDETQQDYVLQSLNEAGSYSTEEVATGKRWIDGKPIYKKSYYLQNVSTSSTIDNLSSANVDNVINIEQTYRDAGGGVIQGSYFANGSDYMRVLISQQNWDVICNISAAMSRVVITIYYTKTT